ncbi:ABC transporter permease [Solwaraspora sp. WMMD1047]|uniref:ABC transporter permease n=1 Tax=Solwaraspora sp. WMMD1047 TaxID=3016102 RepID=UPI002417ABB8|nr:ABC transporter permease [Solwaraspora sp. WMMD1047]MDG4830718.1 ABC transporter permease [Solwaraspora sp. WMMD1047]
MTVHWPSVRGRARADAGSLLLVAVVVAVVTLLAGTAPPLLRAVADEAVRAAVRDAAGEADVLAHANWLHDYGYGGRVRDPRLADDVDDLRVRATEVLDPRLRDVLRPPAAVVTSPALNVTDGSLLRTFRLTYLADEDGPHSAAAVSWLAGAAPAASVPPADSGVTVPNSGPPWPVQVGLAEATATALGLRPGDRIPLADQQRNIKNVQISGIFRPVDETDPDWRLAPELLGPVTGGRGVTSTRLGGLLSPESLPDARLAFDPDELVRTIRFSPEPAALGADSAESITATLISIKANSGSSAVRDATLRWESQLDSLLRDVQVRVNAAAAQASVLLIGVLLGAVLILILAADMLVRRRSRALTAVRQRGVGLPGLGAELLIESATVAVAAAGVALVAARMITPGVSWWWAIPVIVAAALAGPAFGSLVAARGTRDRRAPANPGARRWLRRTARLRAGTAQAALLLVAAAALVALHQRGILQTVPGGALGAWSRPDSGAVLPSSAPALGVLAATFVLLWPLPWALRAALRQGLRSRHPLVAFGAARAAATAARTLPLLAMVTCAGLASFAFTVDATTRQGLTDGAWRTVGADVRLDVDPAAEMDVPALAGRIAASAGVEQAVAAQIVDGVRITTESATVTGRLVVVETGEFERMLAATALPDAPELARLRTPTEGAVPALVHSGDGSLRPGMRLGLSGQDRPDIELVAVGAAPTVGEADDVVIVDSAVLAAAGVPADPNTIWVRGPATAAAVAAHAAGADAVLRAEVLRERRTAPLTAGLLLLARASALTLAALGLLGLALGVATSAPQRWLTLSRLRTIGLRAGEARRVTAVELVPPVLLAAVGGPLLGVAVGHLTVGPLALRLLAASDRDPAVTVAWWAVGLLGVAFVAAAAAAVPIESALRRRLRLSEILRAGDG